MKKILLTSFLLILVFANASHACYCSISATITYQYQTSGFVATVKILKNYKNTPDTNQYYKTDIEIIDLYKGTKLKSIYVLGNNGGNTDNSCGTFIKEGETRLIFGNFNQENNISTYLCTSYLRPLELNYKNNQIAEKLDLLKKAAKNYKLIFFNDAKIYPHNFNRIYNPLLKNHFSIIKLRLDENSNIESIKYMTKETKQVVAIYEEYFRDKDLINRLKNIKNAKGNALTICFEIYPYTGTLPKS